jgi:hypothetical protein
MFSIKMKARIRNTHRPVNRRHFRPEIIIAECDCGHSGKVYVPENRALPHNLTICCSICTSEAKYKIDYFSFFKGKTNILTPID